MGMNKNTILAWATFIMILMGLLLIGLGIYRYGRNWLEKRGK
jgi:predicted transporter